MKQYKYDIEMRVPLGIRHGILSFSDAGGHINGFLNMFEKQEEMEGTLSSDGTLEFKGNMVSLIQSFPYEAKGRITNTEIELCIHSRENCFHIVGKEAEI